MPDLTRFEKAAGKVFRDQQTAWLLEEVQLLQTKATESGATFFVVPPFLANFRHQCPKHNMISTAMKLTEQYIQSPQYLVYELAETDARGRPDLHVLLTPAEAPDGWQVDGATLHKVEAGRFGFVYRSGKCHCGATGQSRVGKLVDAQERPPLRGKEAR